MAKKREIDQKQEKKIGLFDFVGSISETKQYIFDEDTKSVYNAFMINKAMMQHLDTILLANETNKLQGLTDEMHHDFLFYAVDPKKRYGKWAKKQDKDHQDVIQYLQDHYQINNERALEYLKLLPDEEIDNIETKLKNKGGKAK